ncbi:MAG: DUF2878 domain-containing protein [Rhizobiales bacterium]|nr:DUF2878 domain-containing protein [Rhizobacter sp.]
MSAIGPSAATRPVRPAVAPTRGGQVANFVAFQLAWFAAVLGAAHQLPLWGTACLLAVIAWHIGIAARPKSEAALVGIACAIGFVFESAVAMQGHVEYPSGQPVDWLAPYWMVALWGELAIALNVTMRWLKRRLWLASLLGAVGGPGAFSAGVALGGAQFVDKPAALLTLTCGYAVLMPLMVWFSNRFDGVSVPEAARV